MTETRQGVSWVSEYDADADKGTIVGGTLTGEVLVSHEIQFQHGPIQENGVNGIQNEPLIDLLIIRLQVLDERFPCVENKNAIESLSVGVKWLRHRHSQRRAQGVETLDLPHTS